MTDQTFLCPHCQKEIALTEALSHQLQDRLQKDYDLKLEEQTAVIAKKAEDKLRTQVETELRDKANQLAELREQSKRDRAQVLELMKLTRELKKQGEDQELEFQKKLAAGEEAIRQQARKRADEEYRLKELEFQKKLADVTAVNDELRRKLEQGSQQTQGEILELDLETTLRNTFLNDVIAPVEKGVRGADVQQIVKSPKGFICGTILWEFKNTKAWTDSWTAKLLEDMRSTKAVVGIIITTTLPKDSKSEMEERNGIWVCTPKLVLPLATLIRQKILDVAFQKAISVNKASRAEQLYEYVMSIEFKQQVEAIVGATSQMQSQIANERRAMEKIWKEREAQLTRIISSTAGVYGSIQGKVGSSLPPIRSLELLPGGDDN